MKFKIFSLSLLITMLFNCIGCSTIGPSRSLLENSKVVSSDYPAIEVRANNRLRAIKDNSDNYKFSAYGNVRNESLTGQSTKSNNEYFLFANTPHYNVATELLWVGFKTLINQRAYWVKNEGKNDDWLQDTLHNEFGEFETSIYPQAEWDLSNLPLTSHYCYLTKQYDHIVPRVKRYKMVVIYSKAYDCKEITKQKMVDSYGKLSSHGKGIIESFNLDADSAFTLSNIKN